MLSRETTWARLSFLSAYSEVAQVELAAHSRCPLRQLEARHHCPMVGPRRVPPLARLVGDRGHVVGRCRPHRADFGHQSPGDEQVVDQFTAAAVDAGESLGRRDQRRQVPEPLAVALIRSVEASRADL